MDFDSRQPAVDQTVFYTNTTADATTYDSPKKRPTKRIRNRKTREQNLIMINADSRWLTQVHSWTAGVHTMKIVSFYSLKDPKRNEFYNLIRLAAVKSARNNTTSTESQRYESLEAMPLVAVHWSLHRRIHAHTWHSFNLFEFKRFQFSRPVFSFLVLCAFGSDSMQRQTRPHHEWCAPSHDFTFGLAAAAVALRCIVVVCICRRDKSLLTFSYPLIDMNAVAFTVSHTHAHTCNPNACVLNGRRCKTRTACHLLHDFWLFKCLFEWVWVCVCNHVSVHVSKTREEHTSRSTAEFQFYEWKWIKNN